MLDRRDLPHRIDGQVWFGLHRRAVIQQLRFVRLANLLEHPPHRLPPRLGIGVENKVSHGFSLFWQEQSRNYSPSSACSSISSMASRDFTLMTPRPSAPKCSSRCIVAPLLLARARCTRPSSQSSPAGPAKPVTAIAMSA